MASSSSRASAATEGWWTTPTPKQIRLQQMLIARAQAERASARKAVIAELPAQPAPPTLKRKRKGTVCKASANTPIGTLRRPSTEPAMQGGSRDNVLCPKPPLRKPPLRTLSHSSEIAAQGQSRRDIRYPKHGDRIEVKWEDTWFPGRVLLRDAERVYVTFPNFSTNWDDWYGFRERTVSNRGFFCYYWPQGCQNSSGQHTTSCTYSCRRSIGPASTCATTNSVGS